MPFALSDSVSYSGQTNRCTRGLMIFYLLDTHLTLTTWPRVTPNDPYNAEANPPPPLLEYWPKRPVCLS